MITLDLLHEFEQLGVRFWREGDALKFEAPKGVMTPERKNILKQHKFDLFEQLAAGGARIIEPLHHANDTDTPLTPKQRIKERAMLAIQRLHERKGVVLVNGGYLPDNAMVSREEWRAAVIKRLRLTYSDMDKLERELVQEGRLSYEADRLYVVVGNGSKVSHSHRYNPDFLLDDDSGQTFCNWLYS